MKKITLIISFLLLISVPYLLAADRDYYEDPSKLTSLEQQARYYRKEGFKFQEQGDLDIAFKFYKKAVVLDPQYAIVYNDLGVMYEAQGDLGQAEDNYLKALKLDPSYASVYSNLALLYEARRDLNKAAYYWKKRAELGSPDDFWTWKAKQRLEDINLVSSRNTARGARQEEVNDLMSEVINRKSSAAKQPVKETVKKEPQYEVTERGYSEEMKGILENAKFLNAENSSYQN